MPRIRLLLVTILLPFAMSRTAAALDPAVVPLAKEFLHDFGAHWTFDFTPDGNQIASLTGRPTDEVNNPDIVASELFNRFASFRALPVSSFASAAITRSGDRREYLWQQRIGTKPIANAYVLITLHGPSGLYDAILNDVPQQSLPPVRRTAKQARAVARRALHHDLRDRLDDRFITAVGSVETKLLAAQERVHRVYYVVVTAYANDGMTRLAMREYAVDVSTASDNLDKLIVLSRDLMPRNVEGKARIFDPNPANALNKAALKPQDVTPTSFAYVLADLHDLADAVNGYYILSGPYIRIVNLDKPDDQPPRKSQNGSTPPEFLFDRGDSNLPAAMTYVHVDRMQRHVENIGLGELVQKPLEADVYVQASSAELTAGYIHRDPDPGYLWFSMTNGVYAAEDADVIAHEYGHALLSQNSKGRFDINRTAQHPLSEATSVAEGFCDYWALTSSYAATMASTFNIDCFAEWGSANQACFRTYTKKPSHSTFDGAYAADPHKNGEIWSGVLFAIFQLLANKPDDADYLIVRGQMNRMFKGDAPTMIEMADGIVIADSQEAGSIHHDTLCTLFEMHDIKPACCVKNGCSAKLTDPPPPLPIEFQ